jgi:diguanylate cyclase (GGDEF)-like protein
MSNQQKCACDYVVDLTAQLDNAKLNQVFKKSLELLIVDTEFKWELPSLKDIRESNHSAVNIRHKSDSAKIEIFLGNQVIANCSINKVLSVKEKTQLNMLANVFINQKRHVSLSSIDQLTGVLNRQAFNEKIKLHCQPNKFQNRREINREKCLALLDIDLFKNVNDNFGHLIGDEVLVVLGQKLNHAFRDDDLTFRYGGEEFAIILSDVNIEQAIDVLDRFRKTINEHVFPQLGRISISIGIAHYEPYNQPSELIGKADKALYYAKDNGRNKVFSYQNLVKQGRLKPEKMGSDIEFL